jgi:glycosyltransferase involved in cell wall biosynthesis
VNQPSPKTASRIWHTDDLLIRLAKGESVGLGDALMPPRFADVTSAADVEYGKATLTLVANDPERYERHAVLRSEAFKDDDLIPFGARARSLWALNALVGRKTNKSHDWASFSAAVLEDESGAAVPDEVLSKIPVDGLWSICILIHERNLAPEIELKLLAAMAARVIAGESIRKQALPLLVERLLQADLVDEARALVPRVTEASWLRHAFSVELRHPRFGGSYDSMLRALNETYRQLAIEEVSLSGEAGVPPFHRLHSEPESAAKSGPLVTIIMTCWNPGIEIFTAVRSIIAQTYQNWELIVTDDASPNDVDAVLAEVAALDSRIRVIRNEVNAGTYVRRNEAINLARGELVTMQDSDDWAHPRRLETQANDLARNPLRLANVVNAARMTESLSLVSRRGSKLFLAEPALMFRREAVVSAIGYYDSIRKSADTEFRRRLESVTKRPVPTLLPGAPLQFMLADEGSLSGADFGTNIWNHPDRLTYWSATRRFLSRIESGQQDPYIPFPQSSRAFHAPRRWTANGNTPLTFDVVVVLDGRDSADRSSFHTTVAEELKVAAASGLRIAVLQSDSLQGPRGMAFFPFELQALVDSGVVDRIGFDDEAQADVVVVRHAVAVQGHLPERSGITARRVVVIQDAAAGDVRGSTIAKPDVVDTVTAWFGVAPEWDVAPPTLPVPAVTAISSNGDLVTLTIGTEAPSIVRRVRIVGPDSEHELATAAAGPLSLACSIKLGSDALDEWVVHVDYDAGDDRIVTRTAATSARTVFWNTVNRLALRTEDGGFRLLPATPTADQLGSRQFSEEYASATVSRVTVVGEQVELAISESHTSSIAAVYGLREVDNSVIRRRDFAIAAGANGEKVWRRPLTKFADSRWHIFGSFRTPEGLVDFPIQFETETSLNGTEDWQPQALSGGRLLVASPQPSKAARATNRLKREIQSRLQTFRGLPLRPTATSRSSAAVVHRERQHFGPDYGIPRIESAPVVSVIMPVYNVEPYLDAAISSVLEQDFTDIELILIDDASTDNGRRIIAKYWKKDPRVRVFALDHNTLGGAGVPSNVGIRAARGEYIAFADSDDYVTKSGLARMVKLAETHEAELVIGDFQTFSDKLKEGTAPYDHAVWKEFPLNTPISAFSHPDLFRLSPVPWRKLYRRDFMQKNGILYPEGDYFYEDNPLHWFVLSRAQRVVACDDVISFHRQEREGQTMGAQAYKLGSFVNHANTVLNYISESTDERRDVLFEAFFSYLDRSNWTVKSQTQPSAAALIRRGLGDIYERAIAAAPNVIVPPLIRSRLVTYRSAYPDVDLTIVIPVFNSADLLRQTLDSVLALTGLRFNVLAVDDGSTDDSLSVLKEYEANHANVHVFAQGNRGAGRARNSIIPLCTGRYTFFLDADDVVDADALAAAVAQADAESADLLFVKYRIDFVDEGRSQAMFGSDRELWTQLPDLTSNEQRQALMARLINYPWNRVIRTSLLHDANIFFGATVVHNDVLYHWHSIVSAQSISYLDVEVCAHRKFATRNQVTNISDARRLAVLEALRSTHERISTLSSFPNVQEEWRAFALHLLDWARDRVPVDLHEAYDRRRQELIPLLTRETS